MLLQSGLRLIIIPMDSRILNRFIHSLDLSICPRMRCESELVLDSIFFTNSIENMRQRPVVPSLIRELHAVVRQNCVNFVRNLLDQVFQKLGSLDFPLFFSQFDVCKLARAVDRDKKIQLSFFRANLSNINVKIADRVFLELLFRLFLLIFRQFADPVTLKKPMQR